ncbi:MAG: 3-phosphoshikimate 1-carboxyvinyltransferase [Clostridia bacterium]|nr:3-phosphoshikimate 1-carboxyvinyltransferase [Clostridia bacterium]
MNITLLRQASEQLHPIITAPPSKSDAHRLLILAALSDPKRTEPINILCSDTNADIKATVQCLCALGAVIHTSNDGFSVHPIDRNVTDTETAILFVGESGSTLRFLLPVIGAIGKTVCIKMEGRLPLRPLSPLDKVLTEHGMAICRDDNDPSLLHISGQLTPGDYVIDGNISSQFISGLLFALPLLPAPSVLQITGEIASAPYIALTLSAHERFQHTPICTDRGHRYYITPTVYTAQSEYRVEGDYSGAAFLLCAGALGNGITVQGLRKDSLQGDRRILSVLSSSGCCVTWNTDNSVTVLPPKDKIYLPIHCDANDIPDLVPPIAVFTCAAKGVSHISGCERLRIKESDRLSATVSLLTQLGASVSADDSSITVNGTGCLSGGICEGYNDHRMVMSAALAAQLTEKAITVTDKEAIGKSYPHFFDDIAYLGIHTIEASTLPSSTP